MTLSIMTLGIMTLGMMALSIMTFTMTTFSITTLSITTHVIMGKIVLTFFTSCTSLAECSYQSVVWLSIIAWECRGANDREN